MKKIGLVKKFIAVVMACVCAACLGACSSSVYIGPDIQNGDKVRVDGIEVTHNTNFGGINIQISIDDFNSCGFYYGDAVRIELSDGTVFEDVPYFDGYHTRTGELVLCAYPGYKALHFTRNSSGDIWEDSDEGLTASIILEESGRYSETEMAMSLVYYDEEEKYETDEIFANFRAIECGNIKEGTVYRSASPCNNEHNRAAYVDELAQEVGIRFILNLADNEDEVAEYMAEGDFNSPYFVSLLESGAVKLIDLASAYRSEGYMSKLADGFIAMSEAEPPYLFHCTEGKDRTGFVAILIESLCGADYDEMRDDYMITYLNYYDLREEEEPEKYAAIVDIKFNDMVFYLESLEYGEGVEETEGVDFAACARDYLKLGGMSDEQIDTLVEKICN